MVAKFLANGLLSQLVTILVISSLSLTGLYGLLASPPLHLIYGTLPYAGSNSVYVPGSGFAGFWYHMGLFHNIFSSINQQDKNAISFINSETNFYCYSSGCLSLVLSALQFDSSNKNGSSSIMDIAYDAAFRSQNLWLKREINQYDIVETFLQDVIINPIRTGDIHKESILNFLPRLNILITTGTEGVQIRRAESIEELIPLLRRTTWIPFVTGHGFGNSRQNESSCRMNHFTSCKNATNSFSNDDWFLDGGFSRTMHPPCEHTISVPTNWMTLFHTLNPGMRRETVLALWSMGLDDSLLFSEDKNRIKKDYHVSENIVSIGTSMTS